MNITGLLIPFALAFGQDVPTDVPKAELPKLAECLVCKDEHGQEKPAGGVSYKGKIYYFCNTKEIGEFKKDPDSFIPLPVPRPMPLFEVKGLDGKIWNEEAMKGKLYLIDWWATWCKPCIEMFPKVEKLREKYAPKGFEVLSVSIDQDKGALDRFLGKRKFPNPVLHDTMQTYGRWGVSAIPAMFLVRDGQIVEQWTGKVDEKKLSAAVEKHLLKG